MNITPHAVSRGDACAHGGRAIAVAPLHVRVALSLSRVIRKAARLLERLADRLETWARVRSLATGERQAVDTITLTPLAGSTTPMAALRDARTEVVVLSIARPDGNNKTIVEVLR